MFLNKILSSLPLIYPKTNKILFLRNLSSTINSKQHEIKENVNVDSKEIAHHSNLADDWWNKRGAMRALHSMNQIRVPFIRDGLISTEKVNPKYIKTGHVLKDLNILEVGCGGGILTEPLARIHANMTGIDPGEAVINVAKNHSSQDPKIRDRITYKIETIEEHAKENHEKYDAVIISEVLEHIVDKTGFLSACVSALKPEGSIFITTFNKTNLSWLGGIVIAENFLNLVPKNTHEWDKFIPPIETQRILEQNDCSTILIHGIMYEFWCNSWKFVDSTQFSYALQAVKK